MTEAQEHYNWIMNIIDSCIHKFHFECVDNLIELFKQRHPFADEMAIMLEKQRAIHYNNVHQIPM